jgi:DNA-binding NarL/FixJ family response regulator
MTSALAYAEPASGNTQLPDLPLSLRELEVAQPVARGQTNRQIAEHLVISARSAENHVQHIQERWTLDADSGLRRRRAHSSEFTLGLPRD